MSRRESDCGIVVGEFLHAGVWWRRVGDVGWEGTQGERDAQKGRNDNPKTEAGERANENLGTGTYCVQLLTSGTEYVRIRTANTWKWEWEERTTLQSHKQTAESSTSSDTEDQEEWRYVTFNGSEISPIVVFEHRVLLEFDDFRTVWPAKAGALRTWSHVVSGHRPHLCLEFTSPALIKVVKSIDTKKKGKVLPSPGKAGIIDSCQMSHSPELQDPRRAAWMLVLPTSALKLTIIADIASDKDKWRGGRQYHSLNVYVTIEHSSWCEMALSISDIRIFMEHQSVLSFLSAEVLVLTKNFEELTVLDESPVFPVWPSPPRVEQLGVGRGRAQLKIRIKHVLHQHG
ncbi:hypothetical protein CCUS01_06287 [Colletotrichum cuscutae]|uniref:Uncharacterized protein n=1 Tax=Colletotrichum cuscutae TaxID=1209917 RepID=A0AAI9V4K7_9PEZI|nr:hypothetical protein CCUS01_06287 [Colletotrichum cuscutae]